jgi:hypothetical protein
VEKELKWWSSALRDGKAVRHLYEPSHFIDIQAFSDASSEVGIGLVIGSRWRAWKLVPDWKTRNGKKDIGWAEAVGFELLVYTIATSPFAQDCVIAFGDNTGVVEGWYNGRHRNREANECFKRVNEFISSLFVALRSTPSMYQVSVTQLMAHREVSMVPGPSFSPTSQFPAPFAPYSSTPPPVMPLDRQKAQLKTFFVPPTPIGKTVKKPNESPEQRQRPSESGKKPSLNSPSVATSNSEKGHKFGAPIPSATGDASPSAPPYTPSLTPQPSPLRPHCLARERLRLWKPAISPPRANNALPNVISEEQLDRILQVINAAWAESTKTLYGAGLLVFHVYCNTHGVPEEQRCPVATPLMLAFLASCAGSYSGASLSNYVAGLKAWHLLHGHSWDVNSTELKTVLEGASRLTPPSSKRAVREAFTPDTLALLKLSLNLQEPLHAAVFACVTICFWSIARLGELTVANIKSFDSQKHITQANMSQVTDRDGNQVRHVL